MKQWRILRYCLSSTPPQIKGREKNVRMVWIPYWHRAFEINMRLVSKVFYISFFLAILIRCTIEGCQICQMLIFMKLNSKRILPRLKKKKLEDHYPVFSLLQNVKSNSDMRAIGILRKTMPQNTSLATSPKFYSLNYQGKIFKNL